MLFPVSSAPIIFLKNNLETKMFYKIFGGEAGELSVMV